MKTAITSFSSFLNSFVNDENQTDKYGFQRIGRRVSYNNTVATSRWSSPAGMVYFNVWDQVTENRKVVRGDFKTPTNYRTELTEIYGKRVAAAQSRNVGWVPYVPDWLVIMDARYGSVESFGFAPDLEGDVHAMNNAKILDASSQWSAAVDAAELGQTTGLLKDLSSRLLGVSTGIIRRDPELILDSFGVKSNAKEVRSIRRKFVQFESEPPGFRVGDAAANLWMQYRYGLKPLLFSIEDARDAFINNYDPFFETQSTAVRSGKYVASNLSRSSQGITWEAEEVGSWRKSVRIKTVVSFRDSLKARIRGNPVAEALGTAYELMPYSWMLDWAVGVGDYINQLNIPTLTSSYNSVLTTKGITEFQSRVTAMRYNRTNGADFRLLEDSPSVRSRTTSFQRRKTTGPALGNLLWGTGLSSTFRQLDLASLTFLKVGKLNRFSFH